MNAATPPPLGGVRRWVRRAARGSTAGLLRLFRLRENRERIARGFALGLIVNFLPSFGFGVLVSGFFARVLGGNLLAGIVGGATLTFAWPLLFYMNMRVGSLFVRPPREVDDLSDVTEAGAGALVWGQTFAVGSLVNCLAVGLTIYALVLALYRPLRPRMVRGLRRVATRLNAGRRSRADVADSFAKT